MQALTCANQHCVPAGKYIARMCANKTLSDTGSFCMSVSMPTYIDVPFDFPTPDTVEGVLP